MSAECCPNDSAYLVQISSNRSTTLGKAALRVYKELQELSSKRLSTDSSSFRISFPCGLSSLNSTSISYPYDILSFDVRIFPYEGLYKNASFLFRVKILSVYPFVPPKVRCLTRVLHPAINFRTGEVYLDLLI